MFIQCVIDEINLWGVKKRSDTSIGSFNCAVKKVYKVYATVANNAFLILNAIPCISFMENTQTALNK